MKVALLNDRTQSLGGGWTFRRNLIKGFSYFDDVDYVESIEEADICLVAGATMVTRDTINKVQELGKKLVVRLDNVPRNSRNRNTGTSRLKEFAERADAVVWQCSWAKEYLSDFITPRKEVIIFNGVDTDIFKHGGAIYASDGLREDRYLYSRYNRDETKNWEVAWYKFQLIARENPAACLIIVGNFSDEQKQYNFDFFRGERIEYLGVVDEPVRMAAIMRGCKYMLATYYNDCYSNTYQEALACDMELFEPDMSGGTPELIKNGVIHLEDMTREYVRLFRTLL